MRIAYVNADCGIPVFGDKGGAVHIREMVRALREIGCDLRLLSTRLGSGEPGDLAELTEHVAAAYDEKSRADPSAREAKERSHISAAEAVETRLVELNNTWPIDLIYERYSLWSAAGVRAARRIGVPVVLEVNAPLLIEQAEHRQLVLKHIAGKIEQEAFGGSTSIIVVSESLRNYVAKKIVHGSKVSVLGNGVDTKKFNPLVDDCRSELGFAPNHYVVGFTGSLKNWHGVDTLMKSFRQLHETEPNARLLVVGDGPKRGWIAGFAEGAGISNSLSMTGWVGHDKLPQLVASMDVATAPYPAAEDSYFSPLKLYEYLALGRPIVASDIGQTGALIRHGQSGLLVPPGDHQALAAGLLELYRDKNLARKLSRNAAEEGERHSWIRNAKAVLALSKASRRAA